MSLNRAREPRPLLVRADGGPSPLHETEWGPHADPGAVTRTVPAGSLGLPEDTVRALDAWSRARPRDGFTDRPALRAHVGQGMELARRVARNLGPEWVVRYWDEQRRTAKSVCWGCRRLHWTVDAHGEPPHPLDLVVMGEYAYGPLRADGFGDFFPDDPAAALALSDDLVADLYRWAQDIDAVMNTWLGDRDDARQDAAYERLRGEGELLTARLAAELGAGRTVTFGGV
ncbi:hypothetical protein ABZ915_04920 [Streptomyces sp. NPDC046915]|uniref:hypothetical protein n=1 Tax=Streptomyces sp. NPDC046915 TaxID=3155257 RepID=UPI0034056618